LLGHGCSEIEPSHSQPADREERVKNEEENGLAELSAEAESWAAAIRTAAIPMLSLTLLVVPARTHILADMPAAP
jgi:hypothetical protein